MKKENVGNILCVFILVPELAVGVAGPLDVHGQEVLSLHYPTLHLSIVPSSSLSLNFHVFGNVKAINE
jgi:hypothetical protein